MDELYNKIKAIRLKKGYSQEYMATKMSMTPNGYGKLERGLTDISVKRLEEIAKIFGVSVSDLIYYEDNSAIGLENLSSKSYELLQARIKELEADKRELLEIVSKYKVAIEMVQGYTKFRLEKLGIDIKDYFEFDYYLNWKMKDE